MTSSGTVKIWNAASSISVSNGGTLNAGALDLPAGGPATMLNFAGGTWQHSGPSAAMNHDFTLNAAGGTFNVQPVASILTLGGAASGTGALTKTGAGTLKVTGSIASTAGLTVSAGKADFAATQLLETLTVNSAGSAVISAGVLTVGDDTTASPLALGNGAAAGHLDLTTRGLVIDYAPGPGNDAAALASVRSQIISGFNHGTWNGPGIASSSAAADSSNRAVGYALASEVLGPTGGAFMGQSGVDPSSVLVRYTIAGDANLDGNVGFADLVAVAQHYGISDGNARWSAGDLNYDGNIGFADLVAVAQHYGGALPANPIAGAPADFNADLAAAFASVPEPGAGLLAMVGATILSQRRRREKPSA
jgi:autotransporter-associated beta strand protein